MVDKNNYVYVAIWYNSNGSIRNIYVFDTLLEAIGNTIIRPGSQFVSIEYNEREEKALIEGVSTEYEGCKIKVKILKCSKL